ncbi:MAG: hypothetical protein J5883_03690 [Clostridiales bacterium]|nr:hypothetical protein [Clostridiales bacterium]
MEKIETRYGSFTACSDSSDLRKKYRCPVEYHRNGNVRSLYLQDITEVTLPAGTFQAELMTFYEDGTIKRLFPLYGQISGYWSVEDEISSAPEYRFTVNGHRLTMRPQCIYFYPSGKIRSVTLWPNDSITVNTPQGPVTTKLGFEIYENGNIRSIEPSFGTRYSTEYGEADPFIIRNHMLHAEDASTGFDENGNLVRFATFNTKVEINGRSYKAKDYRSPLIIFPGEGAIGIKGSDDIDLWIDTSDNEVRFD